MAKKVKVIERKLGKKVVGWAHFDENLIEIDPRQNSFEYFETLIHERMHLLFPKMSEKMVTVKSHEMAKFLWDMHYRRVHLK
jgi:hypothetical protein